MHRGDMVHGDKSKPIVDLTIYTKNRLFRVPGSSKWEDYTQQPLPNRQFFMQTRMADRYHSSDIQIQHLVQQINGIQPQWTSRPNPFKRALRQQRCVEEPGSDVDVETVAKRIRLTKPAPGSLPEPASSEALEIPVGGTLCNSYHTQPSPGNMKNSEGRHNSTLTFSTEVEMKDGTRDKTSVKLNAFRPFIISGPTPRPWQKQKHPVISRDLAPISRRKVQKTKIAKVCKL